MIPILGMVLGNTISGISLGLVTTVEELMTGEGHKGGGRGGGGGGGRHSWG
jgi:hypothetical protein